MLIDGAYRGACVTTALRKVRQGGMVYLDNSDLEVGDESIRQGKTALLEAVRDRGGRCRVFVDFTPNFFVVTQGLLAQF